MGTAAPGITVFSTQAGFGFFLTGWDRQAKGLRPIVKSVIENSK
jgi:hypothetical protein